MFEIIRNLVDALYEFIDELLENFCPELVIESHIFNF